MKRVVGIGGVFFKARDPAALAEWYRRHLGLELVEGGSCILRQQDDPDPDPEGYSVFAPFAEDTGYFAPSKKPFMVNFRVLDLDAVLAALRSEDIPVDEKIEDSEFGRFGWIMDPEGNRIELWQPPRG
ncbi:MAG: VOC family protein [Gammaproteobacteria bacterium]|nr:VOC family protein [Gammaproteobacteria bacterium]